MRITTREAQLKTATIEVRSLTLNAKQVTLSVFRQLLNEPLIAYDTGTLNGMPWGRVNYFWKDCGGSSRDHLHAVWQKGDELRRSCIFENPWILAKSLLASLQGRMLDALEDLVAWQLLEGKWKGLSIRRYGKEPAISTFMAGHKVELSVGPGTLVQQVLDYDQMLVKAPIWINDSRFGKGMTEQEKQAQELAYNAELVPATEKYRAWLESRSPSPEDAQAGIDMIDAEARAFVATWQESYRQIAATDQLFIAV